MPILAHKIRLTPTPEQVVYFRKACGTARFTYSGHIHAALTLADRVFACPSCGMVKDRDLNAALNLQHYGGLRRKLRLRTTRLCLVRQHLATRLEETGS